MIKLVLENIFFYRKKFIITVVLAGVILFIAAGSFIFTARIKELADKPLESLQTELILRKNSADKNPADIKTNGVILPFDLDSFSRDELESAIGSLPNIKNISTALVLWQFNVKDNRTVVALDIDEPKVGLRNIESFLMPGGRFFGANDSPEVILERHFATLFGYKVGGGYPLDGKDYEIVGLVDFQDQSNLVNAQIFMPYRTALRVSGQSDETANQAFISLRSAARLDTTKNELTKRLPDFSVLSKDSLLKNLSGLNRMFYSLGFYFEIGMTVISLLLLIFIVKLRRWEYGYQSVIFRFLGWPRNKISRWAVLDSFFVLACAAALALALALLLRWQMPAIIHFSPLINYRMPL